MALKLLQVVLLNCSRQPDSRWSGQRTVEKAEEDYFLGDDDDEGDFVVSISGQGARGPSGITSPGGTALRRKRPIPPLQNSPSLRGSGFQPKVIRPVRSPLDSLSDYSDDDEGVQTDSMEAESAVRELKGHTRQGAFSAKLSSSTTTDALPTLQPPPRRLSADEEEDNLLENLVRPKSRPVSPAPTRFNFSPAPNPPPSPSPSASSSSSKRRRDDDEDEEASFERLAKKPDLGIEKQAAQQQTSSTPAKKGDDPPKRIQVKLGAIGKAVASASALKEDAHSAKDGDTG